jgi:hypothetical protein
LFDHNYVAGIYVMRNTRKRAYIYFQLVKLGNFMAVARTKAKVKVPGNNAGCAEGSFAPLQPHTRTSGPHCCSTDADTFGPDSCNFIRGAWHWIFAVYFLIYTINDGVHESLLSVGLVDSDKMFFTTRRTSRATLNEGRSIAVIRPGLHNDGIFIFSDNESCGGGVDARHYFISCKFDNSACVCAIHTALFKQINASIEKGFN